MWGIHTLLFQELLFHTKYCSLKFNIQGWYLELYLDLTTSILTVMWFVIGALQVIFMISWALYDLYDVCMITVWSLWSPEHWALSNECHLPRLWKCLQELGTRFEEKKVLVFSTDPNRSSMLVFQFSKWESQCHAGRADKDISREAP